MAEMTTSELARASSGDRDQILALLRELERGGQVRQTRERGGIRWEPIGNEDRVAAGAVEIPAKSKRLPQRAA